MRLPTLARYRISTLSALALAGVLLTGCAGESTAPRAARTSELRTSPFVPTDAQKALVGVKDGRYTFSINPKRTEWLLLGANLLVIPSNAVCDLANSSYGPGRWNDDCDTQRNRFTITAVVRNAATDHPRIDFEPALRFHPEKVVRLYMHVSNKATLDASRVVKYCAGSGKDSCVDESLTDASVATSVDLENRMVFRRIKHFSGYVVWALTEEVESALDLF